MPFEIRFALCAAAIDGTRRRVSIVLAEKGSSRPLPFSQITFFPKIRFFLVFPSVVAEVCGAAAENGPGRHRLRDPKVMWITDVLQPAAAFIGSSKVELNSF